MEVILDTQLKFEDHLKMVSGKANRFLGILIKLQNVLPSAALITIYKAFIRHHLDCGKTFYDQTYNIYFHQKLESIQCMAAWP